MLTTQEAACLDIMQTDDMLAIGNWEEVIQSLVAKGYARLVTGQWYGPTEAGLKAMDEHDTNEMRALVAEHNARVGPVIEGEAEDCGAGVPKVGRQKCPRP